MFVINYLSSILENLKLYTNNLLISGILRDKTMDVVVVVALIL